MTRPIAALALLLLAAPAVAAPRGRAAASRLPEVRLDTAAGPIVIELETRRAPLSANNFLAYVAEHRFDGTAFYRTARDQAKPTQGLIQGGIHHVIAHSRPPIAHEPTSKTGLRHVDGTVSMARDAPGTAMGDFFICVGPMPSLDAQPGYEGYAAFGHVVSGMDAVKKILAAQTYPGGWTKETIGQSIIKPIPILKATRIR